MGGGDSHAHKNIVEMRRGRAIRHVCKVHGFIGYPISDAFATRWCGCCRECTSENHVRCIPVMFDYVKVPPEQIKDDAKRILTELIEDDLKSFGEPQEWKQRWSRRAWKHCDQKSVHTTAALIRMAR